MASQDYIADESSNEDDIEEPTLLDASIQKVEEWYSKFNEHIERARNFLTFLYVDQWDLNIRQARELINKPTMEFNKLTAIVRGILGEYRENSPTLTVRGVGTKVKQQTVDIYEGLIRHIEYESDADIAYQIAGRHGLECGWGAARVVSEYESPTSFNQVLRIKPIMDFQSAFWDPTATDANKADGDYCGVYSVLSLDKFKKYYGKICPNPQGVSGLTGNYYVQWNTRDTVMICEMYLKEYFEENIVQLSDDKEMTAKEAKEVLDKQEQYLAQNPDAELMGFEPLSIANERVSRDYKMKHIIFVQNKILEETEYPGRILPIPYFEGDSTVIDGEQIPIPYIQDAIDTQKLMNYIGSEIAYGILRSRKETIMATADMIAGHEDDWLNPGQVQGWLEYNFDRTAGKPEFINPPAFNDSFMTAYNNCNRDLMQILGRFEESRGEETNAVSGKAINARKTASNKPVNLYDSNNQRGIKQIGKICLDMIPHIYDNKRDIMVMGKDRKSKSVAINQPNGFEMNPGGDIEERVDNDLTNGKYDIEIRVDGSFDAQQSQAMDVMIRLAQVNPAIGNLIPDLLAENSGLKNTPQMVERLRTLVPPPIIAKEDGMPPPPPPQQPPNPEIMVQMGRNKIDEDKNKIAMAELDVKKNQQYLDEQKIMQEANATNVNAHVGLTKAAAEVDKVATQKNIAILKHADTMTKHHTPKPDNKKE